jgi:hypothetical protein
MNTKCTKMNHKQTLNEPLQMAHAFAVIFPPWVEMRACSCTKVLRSLLQVGGALCCAAEGLTKIPRKFENTGGTCTL